MVGSALSILTALFVALLTRQYFMIEPGGENVNRIPCQPLIESTLEKTMESHGLADASEINVPVTSIM
jgi:hypothetical protein